MKTNGKEHPGLLLESRDELEDLKDAICLLMESAKNGVTFWSRMVNEKSLGPEVKEARKIVLKDRQAQLKRCEDMMKALSEYDTILKYNP